MKSGIVRIVALAALLGLGACTPPMEFPEVAQRPPIEVGRDAGKIAFGRALSKISLGAQVAAVPNIGGGPREWGCGQNRMTGVEWGGRMVATWTSGLGEIFHDTMKAAGYDVVGDPTQLFEAGQDREGARYAVGARLVDLKGNFCEVVTPLLAASTNTLKGEFYLKVEWEVYSLRERRVTGSVVSEGVGRLQQPSAAAVERTLQLAFAAATANLAADPQFLALVSEDAPPKAVKASAPGDTLALAGMRPLARPLAQSLEQLLDGVVTLFTGNAMGSGFFITADGYGLTNQHVVGTAETVTVRLRSGVEIEAKVLRRDHTRDVALFKAPVQVLRPLPLASDGKLALLDEVFAIGTPADPAMQSTVTKGVVGAFRRFRFRGANQAYIQADAGIVGGNSGGPLVDARGNVVGLSDLGIGDAAHLNLFIPVAEALAALNLTVEPTLRWRD